MNKNTRPDGRTSYKVRTKPAGVRVPPRRRDRASHTPNTTVFMVRSVRARRSGPLLASRRKGPPRRVLLRGRALRRPPLRPNPRRFARGPGLRGGTPPGQLSCGALERYEPVTCTAGPPPLPPKAQLVTCKRHATELGAEAAGAPARSEPMSNLPARPQPATFKRHATELGAEAASAVVQHAVACSGRATTATPGKSSTRDVQAARNRAGRGGGLRSGPTRAKRSAGPRRRPPERPFAEEDGA